MVLAESAPVALALTVILAVLARAARALDTSGALAGLAVGGVTAAGLGLPGLGVLGVFFVGGSAATRLGWKRKSADGTAEAGGGARDARRVLAKGGIAALAAVACMFPETGVLARGAFVGALAAALADTLGTEIGTLARATPRVLPTFRPAPAGTPGAVSWPGTLAGLGGAAAVATAAAAGSVLGWAVVAPMAGAGVIGSLVESAAGGMAGAGQGTGGWIRNLLATGTGAVLGAVSTGWPA